MRRRERRWFLFPGRMAYHADRELRTAPSASLVAECGRGLWGAEEVTHPRTEGEVCVLCASAMLAAAPAPIPLAETRP